MMSLTKEQIQDKKTDEEQDIMPEIQDGDQFAANILASVGVRAASEVFEPSALDEMQEGDA